MSKGISRLFDGTIGSPQLTIGIGYQPDFGRDSVNKNRLYTVRVKNEYLHGPIWVYTPEGALTAHFPVVYNDITVIDLNNRANRMFSSYYKLNANGKPYKFNFEQEKADKEEMLSIIAALISRLDKINDGTFVIDDCESQRLKDL
ncbi:MAG: hypothetical protein NC299_15600 [Lachnospiraceae bacterium]|nr:hypothetical protein [Ruminococcus sp.]MCM1276759.1 hypothetical protein [Lachnospiraceae bacterium]